MSNPGETIGYAVAAQTYWDAGWRNILPLRRGQKTPPPSVKCPAYKRKDHPLECPDCISYTGYRGIEPSYADILEWSTAHAYIDGNLCLRLPDGIIGIDVDAYGAKTGAAALAEAEKRWGALPPAPRTTSRADGISGIRLYRVPPSTILEQRVHFPELAIGDIEIVQRHHRYAVCWPSIHPEGSPYWWYNHDNQLIGIPEPDTLPWLPQTWIDGLRITRHSPVLNGVSFDVSRTLTPAAPSAKVQERLNQALKELNLPGQSRHDTTCGHVLALMRLGKSGEPGVKHAIDLLREVFVAATSVDKSRTPDEARAEFDRMITNPNAARELAQPGLLDWMRSIVSDDASNPVEKVDKPDVIDHAKPGQGGGNDVKQGAEPPSGTHCQAASHDQDSFAAIFEAENGFWEARESLQHIFTAALSRMSAPWAVLAHTAAHVLTIIPPRIVLPPIIGGNGSLNWFAAVAARSGGGKGSSSAAARDLIPEDVYRRNLGSGEGICQQFYKPGNRSVPPEIHEAILFEATEVDTMTALKDRSGQTTMAILRSGFSGETLGFSYRNNDHHIDAHTYRMTLVLSLQPARARALMDDSGGGTPQRFQWFPGTDSRVCFDPPEWPGELYMVPDSRTWQYPRTLVIPNEARDHIKRERVKAQRGEIDALDGHAIFVREKFAFSLALIDGRTEMNLEDWELSGIAAEISDRTRLWVGSQLDDISIEEAEEKGRAMGVLHSASEAAKIVHTAKRVRSLSDWVLRRLQDGPLTLREMDRALGVKRREWLPGALHTLAQEVLICQLEDGKWALL